MDEAQPHRERELGLIRHDCDAFPQGLPDCESASLRRIFHFFFC
jgi:hypothetical protein